MAFQSIRRIVTRSGAMAGVIAGALVMPPAAGQCAAEWGHFDAGGLGMNERVTDLVVMPNGDMIAGGSFTSAGGVAANRIARWNGSAWSPLGTGISGTVLALALLPNGDIVAAGGFSSAGGTPAANVARWNGTSWSALGSGVNNLVNALAVTSSGDLIAGGRFVMAGGSTVNYIARWDGTAWHALGSGMTGSPGYITSLLVMPGGDVVAGGNFDSAGGVPAEDIARWNGATWSPLGPGLEGNVEAMTLLPSGDLIATGQFQLTGNLAQFLNFAGRWNGTSWSSLGSGLSGPFGTVIGWAAIALPSGDVVVAGNFTGAGGVPANNIARWDGSNWSAFGKRIDRWCVADCRCARTLDRRRPDCGRDVSERRIGTGAADRTLELPCVPRRCNG